jgi:hypothetical protein
MARGELWLAERLLDGEEAPAAAPAAGSPTLPRSSEQLRRMIPEGELSLAVHAAITGLIGLLVTAIWAAAGGGYYWPAWVWLGLLIPLSLHFGLREAFRIAPGHRAIAIQVVVSLVVVGITVATWALTGFGTFWAIWTILAAITLLGLSLMVRVAWRQAFGEKRERELTERVETLTETRRGALDVQAAELRRIERDLHDGAQARLVALSMQLGRAEEGLADRPEIAALVRQARAEATAANAERPGAGDRAAGAHRPWPRGGGRGARHPRPDPGDGRGPDPPPAAAGGGERRLLRRRRVPHQRRQARSRRGGRGAPPIG